jgi:hypothetical protein
MCVLLLLGIKSRASFRKNVEILVLNTESRASDKMGGRLVLGIETRVLCMLIICCTTELYFQPPNAILMLTSHFLVRRCPPGRSEGAVHRQPTTSQNWICFRMGI